MPGSGSSGATRTGDDQLAQYDQASLGSALAQTDETTTTQTTSGNGANVSGSSSAKTSMGGGGGGGGEGGGGGGGYSMGASLSDSGVASQGFSGELVNTIDVGGFGDFNTNFGGEQSVGLNAKTIMIIAAVAALAFIIVKAK